MSDFTKLVPCPPANSINSGLHSCPTADLVRRFGAPRKLLTSDCLPVTSPYWRAAIKTEDIGPFRATGHRAALQLFREGFCSVKDHNPALYEVLGSAGMLCCRLVRGTKSSLSNHGLGMALDVTIEGKLDTRGDGLVQRGLIDLYSILKNHGIYWGAEFKVEDSMHFEVSAEVVNDWITRGVL